MEVWLATFTGKNIDLLHPDPLLIDIRDIAHGLSQMCRYTGQCIKFYSVAEHSVRLSQLVSPDLAFAALMHDAAEAYMTDIPHYLKLVLPEYIRIEELLLKIIFNKYHLDYDLLPKVKDKECVLTTTEQRDLFKDTSLFPHFGCSPLAEHIIPWSSCEAESLFSMTFVHLHHLSTSHI